MRDPMPFETRLADAFERYTDAAPRHVDAATYAHAIALGARRGRLAMPRLAPRIGGLRLAIVLGLLALASLVGFLFAGGFLAPAPTPLGGGGRIMAWLPSTGTAHLLNVEGVEWGSWRGPVSVCPTLMAEADVIGVQHRFSTQFVSILDGTTSEKRKNYGGFELWSPDQSAYAMVDAEKGPASVITFPDGDAAHPTVTRYQVFGGWSGSFSPDGSRLALPIPAGPDGLAIHVLQDGTDTVVATVPTHDSRFTGDISWSQDAASLVLVTSDMDGPRLTLVGVGDGSIRLLGRPGGVEHAALLSPHAWSPDGSKFVVRRDSGDAWLVDVAEGRWQPLRTALPSDVGGPFGNPDGRLRWSRDGRLAIVNGPSVTIRSFDGTPDRLVALPGPVAAWSPDGTTIASLANITGDPVAIWVTDVWDTGESHRLALLNQTGDVAPADPPCIQWLPEVQP